MGRTVLAIEDDRVQSTLYEAVLATEGHRVVVVETLADADRLLASRAVDLVLLDLFLPDGDGRSWLGRLRASRTPAASLPVIVIAGTLFVEAQAECYELGAATMLPKPVSPRVLAAAVRGALARGPADPPAMPAVPAAPAAPAAPAVVADVPARAAPVLIAEDDDVVAALVQHRLAREGFTVRRVRDGLAALEAVRAEAPALMVLDIMMPGLNGFELLGHLRAEAATARLPIIMLTGLGGERDIERALALGANDYVLKPFSPVELSARVHRLLRAG